MPAFFLQPFDQRLANLKLEDLALEMNRKLTADEGQIRALRNGNAATPPARRLEMQVQRTDEWAERTCTIYRDTWQKQGNQESAEFVRTVVVHAVVGLIHTRLATVKGQCVLFRQRTRSSQHMLNLDEFSRRMFQLEAKWKRKLEIEATECGYATSTRQASAVRVAGKSSHHKLTEFIKSSNRWGKIFDHLRAWGGRIALLKSVIVAIWRHFF